MIGGIITYAANGLNRCSDSTLEGMKQVNIDYEKIMETYNAQPLFDKSKIDYKKIIDDNIVLQIRNDIYRNNMYKSEN